MAAVELPLMPAFVGQLRVGGVLSVTVVTSVAVVLFAEFGSVVVLLTDAILLNELH